MESRAELVRLTESLQEASRLLSTALPHLKAEDSEFQRVQAAAVALIKDIDQFLFQLEKTIGIDTERQNFSLFLNQLLHLEYSGMVDYNLYADTTENPEIAQKIRAFANTELHHFRLLSQKIKDLNGEIRLSPPTVTAKKEIPLVEALLNHILVEKQSIDLCRKGLETFNDAEASWILGTIKMDEEEHLRQLEDLLQKHRNTQIMLHLQEKYSLHKRVDFTGDEPWVEG